MMEAAQHSAEPQQSSRPGDLLGVRACAAALPVPVSPSTISRQLANGLFINHGTEAKPLLSLAEVIRARAEDLNPAQQRAKPTRSAKQSDGYHSARAEREQTQAQLAALDLKERLGQLLPREQVEDLFADFGRSVRESISQLVRTTVPELSAIEGDEARIAHMTAKLEARLTALADEFEAQGNATGA